MFLKPIYIYRLLFYKDPIFCLVKMAVNDYPFVFFFQQPIDLSWDSFFFQEIEMIEKFVPDILDDNR